MFLTYLLLFSAGEKGRSRSSHCQAKGQEEGLNTKREQSKIFNLGLIFCFFPSEMVQGQNGREAEQRHHVGPGHV
jgi:hypothetical protein